MPTRPPKLKRGKVYGHKKVIKRRFVLGKYEYWDVLCLQCGSIKLLRDVSVLSGACCSYCKKTPHTRIY